MRFRLPAIPAEPPTLAVLASADGCLELRLRPAHVELSFGGPAAMERADAAQAVSPSTLRRIRNDFVSGELRVETPSSDTLRVIPLDAISEARWIEGRLLIVGPKGSLLRGSVALHTPAGERTWFLDEPGLFHESEARDFLSTFEEVRSALQDYQAALESSRETKVLDLGALA